MKIDIYDKEAIIFFLSIGPAMVAIGLYGSWDLLPEALFNKYSWQSKDVTFYVMSFYIGAILAFEGLKLIFDNFRTNISHQGFFHKESFRKRLNETIVLCIILIIVWP